MHQPIIKNDQILKFAIYDILDTKFNTKHNNISNIFTPEITFNIMLKFDIHLLMCAVYAGCG